MGGLVVGLAVVVALLTGAVPVAAQSVPVRSETEQKQARYQIGQMERALEGAVEHGATNMRDHLAALVPTALLIAENARVRGFRLDGYGIFFDVEVPSLEGTLPWTLRTLDQNALGLESALGTLRSHVETAGDAGLQQALKRIELQLGPFAAPAPMATPVGMRSARSGDPAPAAREPRGSTVGDPVIRDPEESYRSEVKQALMDAMIDYSGPLGLGPTEWLTVAARRSDDRPHLAPVDSSARTMVIRVRGSDLAAFRSGAIPRDEVMKRLDVRLF